MGTTQANMQTKRQHQPVEYDVEENDELYQTRMPSSARRYKSAPPASSAETNPPVPIMKPRQSSHATQVIPAIQQAQYDTNEDEEVPQATQGLLISRRRSSMRPRNTNGVASDAVAPHTDELPRLLHRRLPLIPILVGMVVMIVLVMVLAAVSSWWHVYQDDIHYGRPRTSQIDAVVGHNDDVNNPSHFIFINLHRHVEIIEIPGGDASHTRIYLGPVLYGDGQDLTSVTGEVRDVNGDGKPDLVVHIQDQQLVFLNNGTTFKLQ